jgi:hypothetical protein
MMTNAFSMSRLEYVGGLPRTRLASSGGRGSRSTRRTRLTSRLICRRISVLPWCRCVITEILRGQPCPAWPKHGCLFMTTSQLGHGTLAEKLVSRGMGAGLDASISSLTLGEIGAKLSADTHSDRCGDPSPLVGESQDG